MRNPDNIAALARAYALALSIHKSPLRARGRRSPGLSSQLLRSISSIPFNIAEGAALDDPGFVHHLTTAIGSANEAEKQLQMAHELEMLGPEGNWHLTEIVEVRKMIIGLRKSVLRKSN
jgi:four helix bundle protein